MVHVYMQIYMYHNAILQMQSNSKGGEGYIKVDWGKLEEKG